MSIKSKDVTVDVGDLEQKLLAKLEARLREHGVEKRGQPTTDDKIGATLTKVGELFSPERRNREEYGIHQRALPQNVYSAVILGTLNAPASGQAIVTTLLVTGPPLVVTLVAQATLAFYLFVGVASADGDLAPECAPELFYLQCVALSAFCCMVMRDYLEVFDIHQWLQMFERSAGYEALKLQKYKLEDSVHGVKINTTMHRPRAASPSSSASPFTSCSSCRASRSRP